MSVNNPGQWLPLESGNRWQRLRRRIPVGTVAVLSLITVLLLLAIWHVRSPSTAFVAGGVAFVVVALASSAGFALRHTIVWVNFGRERIRIGTRLLRFCDIQSAHQRSTGQFQRPNVMLVLCAGSGCHGSVYLRFAGLSVLDVGCRNRLVALIERSGLPRSIATVTPGFADALPGTPIELSKMSALALVLDEPSLVETRYGSAG